MRAALLGAALLTARVAHAQAPPPASTPPASQSATSPVRTPEFWWIAPPECPDAGQVRARIETLLRRPLAALARRAFSARVAVSRGRRGASRYRAHLETITPEGGGERWIEDASCAHLAETTATVIALAVGADAPAAAPPAATTAVRTAVSTATQPAATARASLVVTPARGLDNGARPRVAPSFAHLRTWTVGVAALLDARLLPSPDIGLRVAASRRLGPVRVEVALSGYAPQERAAGGGDQQMGAAAWLVTAGVRGCYVLAHHAAVPVEIAPCVGLEAGALVASGFAPPEWNPLAGAFVTPWVASTAAGRIAVRLAPILALTLEGELVVPLVRTEFVFNAHNPQDAPYDALAFQTAAAGARVGVGAEVRIP